MNENGAWRDIPARPTNTQHLQAQHSSYWTNTVGKTCIEFGYGGVTLGDAGMRRNNTMGAPRAPAAQHHAPQPAGMRQQLAASLITGRAPPAAACSARQVFSRRPPRPCPQHCRCHPRRPLLLAADTRRSRLRPAPHGARGGPTRRRSKMPQPRARTTGSALRRSPPGRRNPRAPGGCRPGRLVRNPRASPAPAAAAPAAPRAAPLPGNVHHP